MLLKSFIFWLFIITNILLIINVRAGDIKVSLTRRGTRGYVFVDEAGRTRLFHGVNAVYKLPPWIPASEGWDTNGTLSEDDAKNLSSWGFNVVRLGVMWPGVAPKKNETSKEYLDEVRKIVDILGKYDIYTILDLHQDLAGRPLCGEGFPDWAINTSAAKRPFPQPVSYDNYTLDEDGYPNLKQCLKISFPNYYFTDAVNAAFQYVYDSLRKEFATFWGEVAKRFYDCKTVLGYELLNEPWPGDVMADIKVFFPGFADRENLFPMYQRAHDYIRKYDDKSIIFFEKNVANIFGPLGFYSVPGGGSYRDRTALSWHNYCGSVDRQGNPKSRVGCRVEQGAQLVQSLIDIDAMDCGSFLTEFGAVTANSSIAIDSINWLLNKADDELQSWAYWQYKSYNDITTASNALESFYWPNGTLQKKKVDALCRVYAKAVAGVIIRHEYNSEKNKFSLWYRMLATRDGSGTIIYIGPLQKRAKDLKETVKVSLQNVKEKAAKATFSEDNNTVFINHSEDDSLWEEGDEIHVEVYLSNASQRYISYPVLFIVFSLLLGSLLVYVK